MLFGKAMCSAVQYSIVHKQFSLSLSLSHTHHLGQGNTSSVCDIPSQVPSTVQRRSGGRGGEGCVTVWTSRHWQDNVGEGSGDRSECVCFTICLSCCLLVCISMPLSVSFFVLLSLPSPHLISSHLYSISAHFISTPFHFFVSSLLMFSHFASTPFYSIFSKYHQGGATFLTVDASTIENKWLGESEKNAKAVFTLARYSRVPN